MQGKKLVVASDHGGVDLKEHLVKQLRKAGYAVDDLGTHGDESVHYPDFAFAAASRVADGRADLGVLVCGTGIGMSIAANKVKGAYCAKVNSEEEGRLAAEHNHANMLALGGRTTSFDIGWKAVKAWLEQEPGGSRHEQRVGKIREADGER